ncbi:hypothetical protein [Thioalkalivibrio sp. XN279]|uniref:hypothetical protein n=1 Tax=Thioalkalivibrio sp. XN279 TaxID=2714953 RepID=UPI00140E0774|nr:hypothetical protein [Thioalkalivibrio sp. XN279]NHA15348.1 hypothetical protein [Thioalkalivibrio sp. XN279]
MLLVDPGRDALLTGRVDIGDDHTPLHYEASYLMELGDVCAELTAAPKHFGRQRVGQDPGNEAATLQEIDASYEFRVSHRRTHGDWKTEALVGMRYAPSWDLAASLNEPGADVSAEDVYWTANIGLTRHLPAVSLSANWSHSADPMWFLPEIGQRKHRFDMRLDLSRVVASVVPDVNPQVSMQWKWFEARSRSNAVTGDHAIKLDMAVAW